MVVTTAREYQRRQGEFQDKARREPVEITRHGRREFVLMSAERYDWLLAAAQRTHRTEDLPDTIVEAIRRADVHPRHAHLDKLMKRK